MRFADIMDPAAALRHLRSMHDTLTAGWTQGAAARLASGWPTEPHDMEATCFCLFGAYQRHYTPKTKYLWDLLAAFDDKHDLVGWNDEPERTQTEVLAFIKNVIDAVSNQPVAA